jgi:hypothetical protein
MPRWIYCSIEDCDRIASVLVTYLENGETLGLCEEHFEQFIYAMAVQYGFVSSPVEGPIPEPRSEDGVIEAVGGEGGEVTDPSNKPKRAARKESAEETRVPSSVRE